VPPTTIKGRSAAARLGGIFPAGRSADTRRNRRGDD
jgi:hypothetical protein